ncbi:MAG: cadherin-like domain-containing protein [Pirellulaceae bacterium]
MPSSIRPPLPKRGYSNGTGGSNASGNVLTNDTDVDAGDTKTVTGVAAGIQSSTSGSVGASVTGSYGSITVNSAGAYTYLVDQNNAAVQALLTAGDTLTDTFSYTVTDSGGLTSTTQIAITITGNNDAPVLATIEGTALGYVENDGAVTITSTLQLVELDDTNIDSATIQITGNYVNGEDVLSFVDTTNITATWNATNGTLTLSGSDTIANYQAAIRSITYQNLSELPDTNTRTVTFTVFDGEYNSLAVTRDITLQSNNDDPYNAGSLPTDITVVEDVSSDVDLSALILDDLDANGGAIDLTLSTSTGGLLSAVSGGGVTVSGSGTTSLTLSGNLTSLNTFLATASNIQYVHGTPNTDGNDADLITIVANDNGNTGTGGGTDVTLGTVNVDITSVNDEEVLAVNTGATVNEASTANVITSGMLQTTDVDNTVSQLVYTVDVIPVNGTLRLNGTALAAGQTFTQADIDAGLVTYDHDGSQTLSDSFDFTVDDGSGTTTSSTFNFTVSAVNNAPDIDLDADNSTAGGIDYQGLNIIGGGPVAIVDSDATLGDVDSATLSSLVIVLQNQPDGISELLDANITVASNITKVYNAGTGTLTLSGDDTVANYEAVLRTLTYENTSTTPTLDTRTLHITASDGSDTSSIAVATLLRPSDTTAPVETVNTGSSLLEGGTDSVTSAELQFNDDFATPGFVVYSVTTSPVNGRLELTTNPGVAITSFTQADIDSGLVQYVHDGGESTTDSISFDVTDNDGNTASSTFSWTIGEVNDDPYNSGTLPTDVAGDEDTTFVVDLSAIDLADSDAATSALTLTLQTTSGGTLNVTNAGSLTLSGNGTGTVQLTGTLTDLNAYLDSNDLTYTQAVADQFGNDLDQIQVTINDNGNTGVGGGADILLGTVNVDINAVNDDPVMDDGAYISLSEGSGVAPFYFKTLTDVDSADFNGGSITFELIAGSDGTEQFGFTNGAVMSVVGSDVLVNGTIVGTVTGYNSNGPMVVTFNANATLAAVESVYKFVAVNEFDDNPAPGDRTMQVTLTDGDGGSDVATASFSMNPINDAASNVGSLPTDVVMIEDLSGTFDLSPIDLADPDANSGMMTLTLSAGNGNITAAAAAGITIGANGSGTVTLTGTLTDLNAYLDNASNLSYTHLTPNANGNDVDVISVSINDNGNSGSGTFGDIPLGTINVDITAVNDAPVVQTNLGVTVNEGSTGNVITTALLNEGDVDDSGAGLTYTVTSATTNGVLRLAGFGPLGVGDSFTQSDIDLGLVTYDHDDSETTTDSFSFSLADGGEDGVSPATGTFNINITPVNDNSASPIIDTDAATDFVLENATVGTAVGVATFSEDLDAADSITYTLDDNDGGRFAIDATTGIVTVAGSIDRELDGSLRTILVRASSTDGSFQTQSFNIAIGDVDEYDVTTPVDVDGTANSVIENATIGTAVGITAAAADADATNNAIVFSLLDDDGGRFAIDASTGVVTTAVALDREVDGPTRNIVVRATSADGAFADQSFTVDIVDVNEFSTTIPVDLDASVNAVVENAANGTVVGYTASSQDLDATTNSITYSLLDNAGGRFAIDSVSGLVTVLDGTLLDRENAASHQITVRATSTDGSTADSIVSISVVDVDEYDVSPIVDLNSSPNTVNEDVIVGSSVGLTASAVDADATNNLITYSLDVDSSGRFAIDSTTGVVTIASALDYETANSQTIVVRATSADGSSSTQSFTITVVDIDEFDVSAIVDNNAALNEILENNAIGATVGLTAYAFDGDGTNNTISYSLVDDDGGRFSIDSTTGVVTVNVSFDYETDGASRTIVVRADSTDGSYAQQTFTVAILDFNEGPVAGDDYYNIDEDQPLAGNVQLNDTDPDDPTLTATVVSGPAYANSFQLNADGSFTYQPSLDYNGADSFTYRVTDSTGNTATATVHIQIAPVNDVPVSQTDTYFVNQGDVLNEVSGVLFNDQDVDSPSLTAVLVSGTSHGNLTFNSNGTFTYEPEVGFIGVDEFTYVTSDGTASGQPVAVQISVDVAAAPIPTPPAPSTPSTPIEPEIDTTPVDITPDETTTSQNTQPAEQLDEVGNAELELVKKLIESIANGSGRNTTADSEAGGSAGLLSYDGNLLSKSVSLSGADLYGSHNRTHLAEIVGMRTGNGQVTFDLKFRYGMTQVVFDSNNLWRDLEELSLQTSGDSQTEFSIQRLGFEAGTLTAAAVISYVLWYLRGGVLMATLLSQMPTWRVIDPLPILDSYNPNGREGKADSMEEYFQK